MHDLKLSTQVSRPTELFHTIHGSHLYGLAHEGSDFDWFVVDDETGTAKTRHHIVDGIDTVTVSISSLLEHAARGSHQSAEAVFSTQGVFTDAGRRYEPMFRAFRIGGAEVEQRYHRTIRAFAHSDSVKKQRHAIRLGFALADIQRYGRFDPTLTHYQRLTVLATAGRITGDELAEFALGL